MHEGGRGSTNRLAGLGWIASVPPNGFHNRSAASADPYNDNPLGIDTPVGEVEIETTPEHRNLVSGDPRCATWTRAYDDPDVQALRQRMRERNGIADLEVCDSDEVERAALLFHRDGFVAVRNVMPPDQLARLRDGAAEVIESLVCTRTMCGPNCTTRTGECRCGTCLCRRFTSTSR